MVLNVAKSLIRQAFMVSHRSFHLENMAKIKSILNKNSFPDSTIEKLMKQVKCSARRQTTNGQQSYPFLQSTVVDDTRRNGPVANSTIVEGKVIDFDNTLEKTRVTYPKYALGFAGLTYIPQITDAIKGQLQKHAPNLKIACRPPNKVSQVFSDMKQKLDERQNSFVVYRIQCKTCGRFYVGETTRCLDERCSQHAADVKAIKKKKQTEKSRSKTALVRHVQMKKHEFDFDSAKVLKKVRAKGLLKIHEANQIILLENQTVNFKKDARHVSPVFYNLIKEHKKDKKKLRIAPPGHISTLNETDDPDATSEQIGVVNDIS